MAQNAPSGSSFPPILNGYEVYVANERSQLATDAGDVAALMDIKDKLRLTNRSWAGDPCLPEDYPWDALTCNEAPNRRIITLDLSGSGLNGEIPASIANLNELTSLKNQTVLLQCWTDNIDLKLAQDVIHFWLHQSLLLHVYSTPHPLPRSPNRQADALGKLGASITLSSSKMLQVWVQEKQMPVPSVEAYQLPELTIPNTPSMINPKMHRPPLYDMSLALRQIHLTGDNLI
ncbi:hypothetical protein AMTR_s00056p00203590 [Amborella trichopoda]|uniref:Leucine-rich repeat-containing N-terminal plant-type domain-containing protein n=1 Tax=Amborella trichopoda TaxID=13333 RepID=U5D1G4_AMBTC|nr:hypothetical protein AMTR_s00056p00203590 [Amborella trichopoda]